MKCRNILSLNVVIFCVHGISTEIRPKPERGLKLEREEDELKEKGETTVAAILYLSQRFTVECLLCAYATIISIFVAICSIIRTTQKKGDSYNALHFICDFGSSAFMYLFFSFSLSLYLYVYLFSTNLLFDKVYPLCWFQYIVGTVNFHPLMTTRLCTHENEKLFRDDERKRESEKNKRNQFRLFASRCWSAWRSFRFDAFEQKQVNFFPSLQSVIPLSLVRSPFNSFALSNRFPLPLFAKLLYRQHHHQQQKQELCVCD